MAERLFVSGIGTGVGKTVVSAALVAALKADYWKPVQSGLSEGTDTETVKALAPEGRTFHPEQYRLNAPLSPHAAAALEGITVDLEKIRLPDTDNHLVVEGAGGLLVPLNDQALVIDLVSRLNLELVLVSRHYLGSINHTLLSLEALISRRIPVRGIVFIGEKNDHTERVILSRGGVPMLGRLPEFEKIDRSTIAAAAQIVGAAFL